MNALIMAIALRTSATIQAPRINAGCLGAPLRLGTDNVPIGNGTATSVMNVWGFVDGSHRAVGWMYRNYARNYYAQLNYRANLKSYTAVPFASRLLARPSVGDYLPIVQLTAQQLVDIENYFLTKDIRREACFKEPLRF